MRFMGVFGPFAQWVERAADNVYARSWVPTSHGPNKTISCFNEMIEKHAKTHLFLYKR